MTKLLDRFHRIAYKDQELSARNFVENNGHPVILVYETLFEAQLN
jgi:hypothetical protein